MRSGKMMNNVEISVAAMHVQKLASSLSYLSGILVGGAGDELLMSGDFGNSTIERIKNEIELAQSAINAVNREINNQKNEVY